MKLRLKKIVLSAIVCLSYNTAFCQWVKKSEFNVNKPDINSVHVDTVGNTPPETIADKKASRVKILAKDHFYFDYPWKNIGVRFTEGASNKKSEVYEGNYWGTNERFKSIIIKGDAGVEFTALDITKANADNVRYRVIQNDKKEILTWTKPSVFKQTADGKATHAYLGKFDYAPRQILKVEIFDIRNYTQLDAVIIDWRETQKPEIEASIGYFSKEWSRQDGSLAGRFLNDTLRTTEEYFDRYKGMLRRPVNIKDFIETTDKNNIKFRADDSVKNISFWIKNRNVNQNYRVMLVRHTEEGEETMRLGQINKTIDVSREFWKTPGKYTITFTPRLQKHGGTPVLLMHNLETSISFTVLPPEKKYMPVKTVVALILVFITAAIINFTLFRNRQKRKLEKEAQNRQIATLQLQSVRAQLNPHFIFNALAGIQNLINKNAIEDANRYLTRFARLTRNVLDDGQKDLISIEKETDLLDDYLQMEQTRFGFNYSIKVDERIDQQIEIPAMLLQPFAENAVKHGISALKENGKIDISVTQSNKDLLLKVRDNGNGFKGESEDGKGIKLCRERIALFNAIHKNTLILLQINQANNGTIITIELKNWL